MVEAIEVIEVMDPCVYLWIIENNPGANFQAEIGPSENLTQNWVSHNFSDSWSPDLCPPLQP